MTIRVLIGLILSTVIGEIANPHTAEAQSLYGLVIGIDDYIGDDNDLGGAVNDANDIYNALRSARANSIIRLIDGEATKTRIESSWNQLVDQAKADDVIIFTYSGHGSQEPEPPGRNGEEDGLNENFLLAGYQPTGPGTRERIVDDEVFMWLKRADNKGVRVVFVADSCHSGTMHRKVQNQSIRYRNGNFLKLFNDLFRYPDPDIATLSVDDFQNLTFVSATSDERLTPEVRIDGEWRGALSWAFARALEGNADRNRDGEVSQFELLRFIVPAVHAQVERQQTPQILPLSGSARGLFRANRIGWETTTITSGIGVNRNADFNLLRIAVSGGKRNRIPQIPHTKLVSDTRLADLIWDPDSGQVIHRVGGVVAEQIVSHALPPILSKWSTLKWLKSKIARDPILAKLTNGNHRYEPGAVVNIEMTGIRFPYLTLFNLPPNGRADILIPTNNRPDSARKNWVNKSFNKTFRVDRPPYGAEHLVAIYSSEVLFGLHAALSNMSNPSDAVELRSILEQSLAGREFQVVVLDVYTGEED